MTIEECKTLCGLIADGSPSQKFTDGTYKSWHMIIGNLPYVHTFKAWVAPRRHVKYVDTPDLYAVVRRMRTQTRLAIRRVMRRWLWRRASMQQQELGAPEDTSYLMASVLLAQV